MLPIIKVKIKSNINLSEEEVINYLYAHGYPHPDRSLIDWFLEATERKDQFVECVRKGYELCDFDRWQHIQNVLFNNSDLTIKYETAMKIDNALWEEGIETLELWSAKEYLSN